MIIRETIDDDREEIFRVERDAFGHEKEALLTMDLLDDPTAKSILSLLALDEGKAVGHILFTDAKLSTEGDKLKMSIMGPVAVIPEYQRKGVGGEMIQKGLEMLKNRGVDLVFVLGHIPYYPRFGFIPALDKGFDPPYPIHDKVRDAWMVQELRPGVIDSFSGKVCCCTAFDHPEHWRE